jgi:hypothetical protein
MNDLFYDLVRGPERSKHVRAEDALAPEPLRVLVAGLRNLIDRLPPDAPSAPSILGTVEVDPEFGEEGHRGS